jgi:hypothetical protein
MKESTMKKVLAAMLVVGALVWLTGCGPGSGTEGGHPSSAHDSAKSHYLGGLPEGRFTVTPENVTLKQGEEKKVTIKIDRGKNFDEDVMLSFSEPPKGVTISEGKIKHGDKDTEVTVKAAEDAALGDHKIKVTAKPGKGQGAQNEFTVTVQAKK